MIAALRRAASVCADRREDDDGSVLLLTLGYALLALVLVLVFTIGGITPPVGGITFTVCAITGCKLGEFTRAFMPFFLCLLLCLAAIILFPPLTTALPALLRH